MQLPIPTTLLFIALGLILLFFYFFLKKKQNKFSWIYLSLAIILILAGIVPGALLSLNNNYPISKVDCENFNEVECIEHQDVCSLCAENITSSYVGCHSINFCENKIDQIILENVSQRDQAIQQYLLSQEHFSWKDREDSHAFCKIENLKPDKELFPLYVWSYCGEYVIEDGELKTISGSSGPVKVNYPNELSYYSLSKFSYEVPGDGSDYTEDVKAIFPEEVQQVIFNHNVEDLISRAEKYAFVNISNWNLIKQKIADCKVESGAQNHDLTIKVELKDGTIIEAKEPKIDDIFDIIDQYEDKCGKIVFMTE